jgi:hypothetical protein
MLMLKTKIQICRGVIVCIPKTPHPLTPNEYRTLTLLNTDYKLLARLISNRLRPWLSHILTASQYCGRQGNTIFDAVVTVRDAVAHATATRTPLCVVTIDFQEAFGNISHTYLFAVLQKHGFSEQFQRRLKRMYDSSQSVVQINGYASSPVSIRSSVRQGCPLSTILFALCLILLLCTLQKKLPGIRIGQSGPVGQGCRLRRRRHDLCHVTC